jgi:excisionase family DNA binding protein
MAPQDNHNEPIDTSRNTGRTASDRLTVSINEACRMLGVGRTTIYREINAQRLPIFKVGRRTLLRLEDIQAWLRSKSSMLTSASS